MIDFTSFPGASSSASAFLDLLENDVDGIVRVRQDASSRIKNILAFYQQAVHTEKRLILVPFTSLSGKNSTRYCSIFNFYVK